MQLKKKLVEQLQTAINELEREIERLNGQKVKRRLERRSYQRALKVIVGPERKS